VSLIEPFDDRNGVIWYDGEFIPWKTAKIHVLTHGLHYASCVFEGIRVYNCNIFRLAEHHDRLFQSAKILGFSLPHSIDDLNKAARSLLQKNHIVNGYIRTFAWRGSEQISVSAPLTRIHVALAAWETPNNYFNTQSALDRGARLLISQWVRPMPNSAPIKSKCAANYAISTISKHEAINHGYDDSLLLDYRGYIAEASAANIFFVANNVLYTPTSHCALEGITRSTVMKIANSLGIGMEVCDLTKHDLHRFEDAFLTGTACEILPVKSIDEHVYTLSALTKNIMQKYQNIVHDPNGVRL
jgi:branched-chain amino acid aminotransferase group I